LRDYELVPDARAGIGNWFRFYNQQRPHQSLGYRTPAELYLG
jgi:putative transposase